MAPGDPGGQAGGSVARRLMVDVLRTVDALESQHLISASDASIVRSALYDVLERWERDDLEVPTCHD